jgi:hypothetical protein
MYYFCGSPLLMSERPLKNIKRIHTSYPSWRNLHQHSYPNLHLKKTGVLHLLPTTLVAMPTNAEIAKFEDFGLNDEQRVSYRPRRVIEMVEPNPK